MRRTNTDVDRMINGRSGALQHCNALSAHTGRIWSPVTFLLLLGLGLVFTCLWFAQPIDNAVLQVVRAKDKKVLWEQRIGLEERFEIRYIHSVERTLITDVFVVDADARIVTVESRTSSFGAGIAHQHEGTGRFEDGQYVMSGFRRLVGSMHIMPSHLYDHVIDTGEETVELHEEPYRGTVLLLKAQRLTRWNLLRLRPKKGVFAW